MNNLLIYIILLAFGIIFVTKMYIINDVKEHLTPQSDEAIQNLSSLYNKDQLTIGSLNVTGDATAAKLIDNTMGKSVKEYIDAAIAAAEARVNARMDGGFGHRDNLINNLQAQINQRVVIGGQYWHLRNDGSRMWTHTTSFS